MNHLRTSASSVRFLVTLSALGLTVIFCGTVSSETTVMTPQPTSDHTDSMEVDTSTLYVTTVTTDTTTATSTVGADHHSSTERIETSTDRLVSTSQTPLHVTSVGDEITGARQTTVQSVVDSTTHSSQHATKTPTVTTSVAVSLATDNETSGLDHASTTTAEEAFDNQSSTVDFDNANMTSYIDVETSSTSPATNAASGTSPPSNKLSTPEIVAIIIASVFAAAVLVGVLVVLMSRRRRRKRRPSRRYEPTSREVHQLQNRHSYTNNYR